MRVSRGAGLPAVVRATNESGRARGLGQGSGVWAPTPTEAMRRAVVVGMGAPDIPARRARARCRRPASC